MYIKPNITFFHIKAILQYNFKFFKYEHIDKGKAGFEMQAAEKIGPCRGKIFVGGRWKLRGP
jgi:hypothetical protein